MYQIDKDLYQFSTYIPAINLSFHQYLLLGEEPILFHTGSKAQAEALLPELKQLLKGVELKYIFISHFESDECGGLSLLLQEYPKALPICSEVTARQINGFQITKELLIKRPGDKLSGDNFELEFYTYPSEMHLWDGLLVKENLREIFFSSDLMIRFGEEMGNIVEANWKQEVNQIRNDQVPDQERRGLLQEELLKLNPKLVATGHGPCLKLSK